MWCVGIWDTLSFFFLYSIQWNALFVIMGLCLVNLEFLTPGYPMKATKNKIIDNMTNRN